MLKPICRFSIEWAFLFTQHYVISLHLSITLNKKCLITHELIYNAILSLVVILVGIIVRRIVLNLYLAFGIPSVCCFYVCKALVVRKIPIF